MTVLMRRRNFACGGGLLVLLLLIAGLTLSVFHVRPMGVSIGVHSYHRQGDEVSASLVLTNTGAAPLAVPLRFGCQVNRLSGFTNYLVDTRYSNAPNSAFRLLIDRETGDLFLSDML